MDFATTVLPQPAEMLRRLKSVQDEPHLVEKFYPILMRKGGTRAAGVGINLMFALAISDYSKGMQKEMVLVLYMNVENWIKAIVDDTTVRDEALAAARKAGMIS